MPTLNDKPNHDTKDGLYPLDAEEALRLWDRNQTIFTVEMGGIGPGYEMTIQALVFELIRDTLTHSWTLPERGDRDSYIAWGEQTIARLNKVYGFSGAQVGAAKNLAYNYLGVGYAATLNKVEDKRHIQVSKVFTPLLSDEPIPETSSPQQRRPITFKEIT